MSTPSSAHTGEESEARGRIALGAIVLAAILLLAAGGSAPLIDPDEARFARTSLEMMRSGDLVVPTFEGRPRLVKPPLFHWFQATSFRALGVTERAARLPSALATLGSLLLVAWVARRRFGDEGAAWAAAIFLTLPLVLALGKVGTLDALLSVHVFAALALDMAEPDEAGPYRSAAIGGLLGLAFLVKGPVGVVLPLLVMLAGRTASGRDAAPTRSAALGALAGWCVVVLPWGLAFLERLGTGATSSMLRREVLERYFAGTDHVEPPWFYAGVVLVGFLPWSVPLAMGLVRVVGRRRSAAARTALYSSAGLLMGLLFFSLGKGKLPSYILPLAPLAALVVTWELGQELNERAERMLGPGLLTASLALTAALLATAGALPRLEDHRPVALFGAAVYGLAALASLPGLLLRRPRVSYAAAALAAACLLAACAPGVFPLIARQRSAAALVAACPELASSRAVVLVDVKSPSLTFYLDRAHEEVDVSGLAARIARPDRPLFVMVRTDDRGLGAPERQLLRTVHETGKYLVLEELPEAPAPGTPPGPPALDGRREPGLR